MIPGDAATLVAPLLAFFFAAASPGPATLAVSAISMEQGRRAGLILGLGLSLGVSFWGVLAAFGLGTLLIAWAPALIGLKVLGGLYLLYLAWISARSAMRTAGEASLAGASEAGRGLFWRGLALNLMNPKAILAWAAVMAIGLPPDGREVYLALVTALCAIMTLGIYAGYAVLFSMPPVRAAYLRGRRWCDAVFAAGFAVAGLRLLFWRADTA